MHSRHGLYTYPEPLPTFLFHNCTSLWILGTSTFHCTDVMSDNRYEKKDEERSVAITSLHPRIWADIYLYVTLYAYT